VLRHYPGQVTGPSSRAVFSTTLLQERKITKLVMLGTVLMCAAGHAQQLVQLIGHRQVADMMSCACADSRHRCYHAHIRLLLYKSHARWPAAPGTSHLWVQQ